MTQDADSSDEAAWYHFATLMMQAHPEWFDKTISALLDGVQARVEDEIAARADMETALVSVYTLAEKPVRARNRAAWQTLLTGLRRCRTLRGTPFMDKIRKGLEGADE